MFLKTMTSREILLKILLPVLCVFAVGGATLGALFGTGVIGSEKEEVIILRPPTQNAGGPSEEDLKNAELFEFTYMESLGGYQITSSKVSKQSYDLKFPETYCGKPVVSIGPYSFEDHDEIIKVTLPNTIKNVGVAFFNGCYRIAEIYNLSEIDLFESLDMPGYIALRVYDDENVPSKILWVDDIYIFFVDGQEAYLLDYCGDQTVLDLPSTVEGVPYELRRAFWKDSAVESVSIPDGCSVGESAFNNAQNLNSVILGEGMAKIGINAFWNCVNLKAISIPQSVETIGDGAFADCSSLATAVLSPNLLEIKNSAFANTKITTVDLPNSLRVMESSVFRGCADLTSITIPANVETFGDSMFYKCAKLQSIDIKSTKIDTIGGSTFSGCSSLTSFHVPAGVKTIHNYAFMDCTSLQTIDLANVERLLEWGIFINCTSLEELVIPDSVTEIGSNLSNCPALKKLSLGSGLSSEKVASGGLYYDCAIEELTVGYARIGTEFQVIGPNLKKIVLDREVTEVAERAFNLFWDGSCQNLVLLDASKSKLTTIGTGAFARQTVADQTERSVLLPETLQSIGDNAFGGWYNVTLKLNQSTINAIYARQIYSSGYSPTTGFETGLVAVELGDQVKDIANGAFHYCYNLKTINIPAGCEALGDYAFEGTSLENVVIPNSVESVGSYAFDCDTLSSLVFSDGIDWTNLVFSSSMLGNRATVIKILGTDQATIETALTKLASLSYKSQYTIQIDSSLVSSISNTYGFAAIEAIQ